IPNNGIPITHREVIEYGIPFIKIRPGCTKNIQPEKVIPVATIINTHPGSCLSYIKKSTGVIILFWFLKAQYRQ
ncbi:MAG: hypothetical protein QGF80_03515, partial [Pelagibacteraceae bacterium]|nr:hypothetical protein [Pelagibacteraceae bacterium]